MTDAPKTELETLTEQLHEMLDAPIEDEEDALELATVAGSLERLGCDPKLLEPAEAWRKGPGKALIEELWQQVDAEPLLEALEAVSEGGASDEAVEEALYDFDDLIVAAVWCRQKAAVRAAAQKAEAILRELPDAFAPFAAEARALARRREVAMDLDVYGYLLVVADAGE